MHVQAQRDHAFLPFEEPVNPLRQQSPRTLARYFCSHHECDLAAEASRGGQDPTPHGAEPCPAIASLCGVRMRWGEREGRGIPPPTSARSREQLQPENGRA